MNSKVDARGLSCPQPVILAQKAIAAGKLPVEVLVDNVTSRENVRRMAERMGYKVKIVQQDEDFKLLINK